MMTLADVLVYLELYADDSALINLQDIEIPRIRRQRKPEMRSQREDASTPAIDMPQAPRPSR